MLTIEGLIAVISLCLTAYGLGYAIGSKKGFPQSFAKFDNDNEYCRDSWYRYSNKNMEPYEKI